MEEKLLPQLKKIENEIAVIKLLILKSTHEAKKPVKLGGLLKGVSVSEEEIESAKKQTFKNIHEGN